MRRLKILFDSMGAQNQVQQETGKRLVTLFDQLQIAEQILLNTDYAQPISSQLDDVDVLVMLTHQRVDLAEHQPAIPVGTSFAIPDIPAIANWVSNGGGLLLVSNHGGFGDKPTYWPLFDIPLAEALGVTIVPAAFAFENELKHPLTMTPAATAPAAVVSNVTNVQSWDSCGISAAKGKVVLALPPDCTDRSTHGYNPNDYAFAVANAVDSGNVIVAGHSGIAGDKGSLQPSPGQIDDGSNLTFLLNCISYLGGIAPIKPWRPDPDAF